MPNEEVAEMVDSGTGLVIQPKATIYLHRACQEDLLSPVMLDHNVVAHTM